MSRAIFVLSIPRSGSSCVAGCLHRLGVDMGSANYMQNTDFLNPGGYYEDRRFQNITKQIAGQKYTVRYRAPTEDQLDAYWELVMQRCKNYPIFKKERAIRISRACRSLRHLPPNVSMKQLYFS